MCISSVLLQGFLPCHKEALWCICYFSKLIANHPQILISCWSLCFWSVFFGGFWGIFLIVVCFFVCLVFGFVGVFFCLNKLIAIFKHSPRSKSQMNQYCQKVIFISNFLKNATFQIESTNYKRIWILKHASHPR